MGWLLEFVLHGLWEATAMRAYKRYGWPGAAAAFIIPLSLVILGAWLLFAR